MKSKAFFIIFKGLSMKQITEIFLEGESLTLHNIMQCPYQKTAAFSLENKKQLAACALYNTEN